MSFARAVSCTPGSCTITRSEPCCWTIGSATPSSLTRLRRIVMFCSTAPSWMRFCASGLSPATRRRSPPDAGVLHGEIAERLLDLGARLCALGLVPEAHHDVRAFAPDAAVLDLLFAQQRADVGRVTVGRLVERRLHVDLQQEVDAAAEVEAEVHRQRADRCKPLRRRGEQVERDDVVLAELLLQHILCLQLRVLVGKADLDAGRVERGAADRDRSPP